MGINSVEPNAELMEPVGRIIPLLVSLPLLLSSLLLSLVSMSVLVLFLVILLVSLLMQMLLLLLLLLLLLSFLLLRNLLLFLILVLLEGEFLFLSFPFPSPSPSPCPRPRPRPPPLQSLLSPLLLLLLKYVLEASVANIITSTPSIAESLLEGLDALLFLPSSLFTAEGNVLPSDTTPKSNKGGRLGVSRSRLEDL